MEWFLPCLYAFLGCGAFCFIFELRRWWYIVSAAATGAVAWLVYLSLPGLTDVNRARTFLKARFPKLRLAGAAVLGEGGKDADGVVNEINGEEPDFVLSLLGMPLAMDFLGKEQERINAGFWCGLGREYLWERHRGLRALLKGRLDKNRLARSISRYDEGEHVYHSKEGN